MLFNLYYQGVVISEKVTEDELIQEFLGIGLDFSYTPDGEDIVLYNDNFWCRKIFIEGNNFLDK